MNSLKYLLVVCLLTSHFAAHCQDESGLTSLTRTKDFQVQERILLIIDQDFYLAGETINFFAVTLDAGLQIPIAFSSIMYVELYDQDNKVIASKKVLFKDGEAINSIDLPRDITTGHYYIRAYTNYMKNFGPSVFFTKRLKIVNPFVPYIATLADTLSRYEHQTVLQPPPYFGSSERLKISAQLSTTEANRGDSIILDIESHTADSVQYIVAMHLGDEHTSPSFPELNVYDQNGSPISRLTFLPEFTHDIVTGSIKATNSNVSVADKILYLAFVDSISWITRCKTDSLGRFTATMPIEYQREDLVISMVDTTNEFSILLENEFYPEFEELEKEDYFPEPSLKSIIEARMINLQVNDAYGNMKNTAVSAERPLLRFYGFPDNEYRINTYTDLPNLEEFVSEIVLEAFVRGRRSQVNILVKTEGNSTLNATPLVVFDGVPLFQANHLVPGISTEKLKSIQVVASRFFFGSEVYEGILDIVSNDNSFSLVEKDKNSVRINFCPVNTAPASRSFVNFRIPQYTSDLYFDTLRSAGEKATVKIALPQNAGSYTLSIFGYTRNGEMDYFVLPDLLYIK